MNPTDLVVEVRDSALERVAIIPTDDLNLVATARHRSVGTWQITVPTGSEYASLLRRPGAGVIVTLRGKEFISGPVTTPEIKQTTDDIAGSIVFNGVSDSILLSDYLAYPQPSNSDVATQNVAQWTLNAPAETAMHTLVKQNIGIDGSTARSVANLVNGPDEGQGAASTYTARWAPIAYYLNTWAGANDLGYHIIQRGGQLVFETWVLNDMTRDIRLSVESGTLSSAKIAYSAPGLTHAIVGGKGSGSSRVIREYTTTKSAQGAIAWDRRIEKFIDQSGAASTAELQTAGLKELNEKGFTVVTTEAIPTDSPNMVFGEDWMVGDYVTLEFEGKELDTSVSGAVIVANESGLRFGVNLGDATGFNPTAKVAGKLEEQARSYERTTVENEIPTQDIEQAQADITAAQADITVHSASLVTHAAAITAAQADITAAQADITTAQADISTAQADITAAQADITALQSDVTALQTDGNPPSTAPALVTVGALGQIFVIWDGVSNADPVKYEIHVSDTASFTPSGATLLTTTSATMISAKTLADNTPMTYGTTYYFKARAVDDDGASSYSAEVFDQMDQTGIADLAVGSVTAAKLEAVLVLATKIATASGTGVRVEIDEDGIRSYDSGNNLLVEWSAATGLMSWKSAASGERMEINEAGLTAYTNDAITTSYFEGDAASNDYLTGVVDVAHDGTNIWYAMADDIFSSFSSWGLASIAPLAIAVDSTYLYVLTATNIRKFNKSTRTETTGGGWPVALATTQLDIATDGTNFWVLTATQIRKFACSNGAETTGGGSGWPIALSGATSITVGGGKVFAGWNTGINQYATTNGAAGLSLDGWGDLTPLDVSYRASDGHVYGYTGHEQLTVGVVLSVNPSDSSFTDFRLFGEPIAIAARDSDLSFIYEGRAYFSSYPGTTEDAASIDSSTGAIEGRSLHVLGRADVDGLLEVTGGTNLNGPARVDELVITSTVFMRDGDQNIATGATGAVVDFDYVTGSGSGSNGTTQFWSESGGTITIHETGVYEIASVPVVAADANGARRIQLSIGGSVVLDRLENSASGSVSWRFPFNLGKYRISAGQTIQLRIIQTSGSSLNVKTTWLSVTRAGVLAA